jgi:hypothetical protein
LEAEFGHWFVDPFGTLSIRDLGLINEDTMVDTGVLDFCDDMVVYH